MIEIRDLLNTSHVCLAPKDMHASPKEFWNIVLASLTILQDAALIHTYQY